MHNDLNDNSNLEYNSIDTGINNIDYNAVNTTYNTSSNNYNVENNSDDVYKPTTSFDSTNYNSSNNDEEKSKNPIVIVIIIIIAILLLGVLGFLGYKFFFSKNTSSNIDFISVEGGSINPVFSIENNEYTVESLNESVKLVCTNNGKKVNIEGCNKSIVLNSKAPVVHVVKSNNKEYKFNIVQVSSDSPVINNVSGNDSKEWTKKITLTVDATFRKEKNKESYSFDGGKTFQESNSKEITSSTDVLIVVRDSENNLSSIYTEKVEMVDSKAPTFDVSVSNKIATITVKDEESGITNLMVTESSSEPSSFSSIDLTKETVIRYTAIKDGVFYAWAKDKAGNISSKKFTVGNATSNMNQNNTSNNNNQQSNNNQNNNNNNNNNSNSNSNNANNNNNSNKPNVVNEQITITDVKTNTNSWTNKVIVTITAKSNKSGTLVYSFDGGKSYQASNSKTFNSNTEVVAVVKNNSTGKTSTQVKKNITNIDVTPPTCSSVQGASVEWTNNNRNISVICSDSGSGCKASKVTKSYNTTTKTSYISIYDNAGNKKDCPVNVYVDKTAPLLTYEMFLDNDPKKFQLFITDNESGIDLETVKYKEKILKNGVDNIWHKRSTFDGDKEISSSGGIVYQQRYTKKIGIYKYFTITASDRLGNTSEIQISVKD